MNFDADASSYNMPELKWRYGYPTALLLMIQRRRSSRLLPNQGVDRASAREEQEGQVAR
ncbi:MAG TPA: hypothetical protein VJT73_14835 [Polyangiaceae bacterium]|nr:hypothetical protein [Polyangiaceae bacterium]